MKRCPIHTDLSRHVTAGSLQLRARRRLFGCHTCKLAHNVSQYLWITSFFAQMQGDWRPTLTDSQPPESLTTALIFNAHSVSYFCSQRCLTSDTDFWEDLQSVFGLIRDWVSVLNFGHQFELLWLLWTPKSLSSGTLFVAFVFTLSGIHCLFLLLFVPCDSLTACCSESFRNTTQKTMYIYENSGFDSSIAQTTCGIPQLQPDQRNHMCVEMLQLCSSELLMKHLMCGCKDLYQTPHRWSLDSSSTLQWWQATD